MILAESICQWISLRRQQGKKYASWTEGWILIAYWGTQASFFSLYIPIEFLVVSCKDSACFINNYEGCFPAHWTDRYTMNRTIGSTIHIPLKVSIGFYFYWRSFDIQGQVGLWSLAHVQELSPTMSQTKHPMPVSPSLTKASVSPICSHSMTKQLHPPCFHGTLKLPLTALSLLGDS